MAHMGGPVHCDLVLSICHCRGVSLIQTYVTMFRLLTRHQHSVLQRLAGRYQLSVCKVSACEHRHNNDVLKFTVAGSHMESP